MCVSNFDSSTKLFVKFDVLRDVVLSLHFNFFSQNVRFMRIIEMSAFY